jgi:transposase
MALLNVVTAITREITYLNEMVEALAKQSNERKERLRKQYEAAVTEESLQFAATTDELNALKQKLMNLIEEKA